MRRTSRSLAVTGALAIASVGGVVAAAPAHADLTAGDCYTSTYVVPDDVTSLTITAIGAPGQPGQPSPSHHAPGTGGEGAKVVAHQVPVTPGQTLWYGANSPTVPGGRGGGNGNTRGGKGGNGSFVSTSEPTLNDTLCTVPAGDLLVVAGGGGGGGGADNSAGGAGGNAGAPGTPGGTNGATAGAGGSAATGSADGGPGAAGWVYATSCFCRYQSAAADAGSSTSGGAGGAGFVGQPLLVTDIAGNAIVNFPPEGAGGGGGGGGFYGGGGGGGDGNSLAVGDVGEGTGDGGGGGGGGSSMGGDISLTTESATVSFVPLFNTTTTVRSSSNPSVPGAPATLVATVAAGTMPAPNGGTVSFYDDSTLNTGGGEVLLGSAPFTNGSARLQLPELSIGSHTVKASYSGYGGGMVYRPSRGFVTQDVYSTQTITFTSSRDNAYAGGPNYTVSAVSSSGLPVSFSVHGGCTISGATVSFPVGAQADWCVIDADQAGGGTVTPAPTAEQDLTIGPASLPLQQVITFTSTPPHPLVVDPTGVNTFYDVTAVGGASGNPITFSVDGGSNPGACSVAGSTGSDSAIVQVFHGGWCVIDAYQAGSTGSDGSASYSPGSHQQTFWVSGASQQVVVNTVDMPASLAIGGNFSLFARSTSQLPVTFSVDPSSVGCAITWTSSDDSTGVAYTTAQVTGSERGNCIIDADQAGSSPEWSPAAQVQETVPIVGRHQVAVSFENYPPDATIGASYTPSLSPPVSTSPVVVSTSTPTMCSADSGGTVTFLAVGTCTVTADVAGDATYDAAPQTTYDIPVTLKSQSVGFSRAFMDRPVAGDVYRPSVFGGGSGEPVVVGTATPMVCTSDDGQTLLFVAAGTCTVTLDQAGSGIYAAAAHYSTDVTIGVGSQTIGFTSAAPDPGVVTGSYSAVVAGGGSSEPVVFGTSTPDTCSVTAVGLVSFAAAGTCTVTADKAGDTNYDAAAQVTQDITVVSNVQTIAFTAPASGQVGGSSTLVATGGPSTAPVTFTVDSTTAAGVCAVSGVNGTTLTYTGVGDCVIDADQAAQPPYLAAGQVQRTIPVSAGTQAITFTAPATATYGGSTTLTATGGPSGNAVTFSVDAHSDPGVCGVSGTNGSNLAFIGVGNCVVDANQNGSGNYTAATQVQRTVAVGRATLTVTATPASRLFGAANPPLTATLSGFVNGDHASAVSGAAACSTTATPDSAVGPYPITCATGSLVAADYSFTFVPGVLSVTATTTITGVRTTSLTVGAGQAIYVPAGATLVGSITISPGGAVDIEGGSVTGQVRSSGKTGGPTVVRLCGGHVGSAVAISSASRSVLVGGLNCGGDTIDGPLTLTNNIGGVSVVHTTVGGSATITGNSGGFAYLYNTVSGKLKLANNT